MGVYAKPMKPGLAKAKKSCIHVLAILVSTSVLLPQTAPPVSGGRKTASDSQVEAATPQQLLKQGNELLRQEKLEEARELYKKALVAKPDYPEAHYGLAGVYTAQQKVPEAIREYSQVLKLRPGFPGVHLNWKASNA